MKILVIFLLLLIPVLCLTEIPPANYLYQEFSDSSGTITVLEETDNGWWPITQITSTQILNRPLFINILNELLENKELIFVYGASPYDATQKIIIAFSKDEEIEKNRDQFPILPPGCEKMYPLPYEDFCNPIITKPHPRDFLQVPLKPLIKPTPQSPSLPRPGGPPIPHNR